MVADERKPGEEHLYREEKYARIYEIDMLRCIFCGLCEEACPKEAIFLTKETVMSGYHRDVFIYGKEYLVEPVDAVKRIDITKRLTPEVIEFKKDKRQRILIIDEAWWMMKSEDTASFLFGLAKRGRKYYLGLSTITQDVDDFLKSPYGMPIVTNSSIQILLKQSPTVIDHIQQTFNLTDEEKYLLLESGVGEGIFFVGLKHVAIKIVGSYTEDQIITTNPQQVMAIRDAKKQLEQAG